jgi:hypothetical protein
MDLFSLYFQLFHLVSANVVDSIRLVKIAQVTFYIPSPNLLMSYIFIGVLLEDGIIVFSANE